MKKFIFIAITSVSTCAQAYYTTPQVDNSLSARYYRREISTDEYLDSTIGKIETPKISTIYHNDFSRSYIRN